MSSIKTSRIPRAYWLLYFAIGDTLDGEIVTAPTIALMITKPFASFLQHRIEEMDDNDHPFDKNAPFEKSAFFLSGKRKGFGFGSIGRTLPSKDKLDPYAVLFELSALYPYSEQQELKTRGEWKSIAQTLSIVTSIGEEYLTTRKPADEIFPAESQQLSINISMKNGIYFLITCHFGIHFHKFLSGIPNRRFLQAEEDMQTLFFYLHREFPYQTPFMARTGPDLEGNLSLQVPGHGSCALCLHSNSGQEVQNKESGYSIMSKNVDGYQQFFSLLVGILTIYYEFQAGKETLMFATNGRRFPV